MKQIGIAFITIWTILATGAPCPGQGQNGPSEWVQRARAQAEAESRCPCRDPAARCAVTRGRAVYTKHQTEAGAEQRALNQARLKAVEQVCGVHVRGEQIVRDAMFAGAYLAVQSDGYVVEEESRRIPALVPVDGEGGALPAARTVQVELRACVRCQAEGRDPYFQLEASLNRRLFASGDLARLTLRASRPGWLYIFNLMSDNRAICLHPCLTRLPNKMPDGKFVDFPPKGGLKVNTNSDHEVDHEAYLVVLARREVDFASLFDGPKTEPVKGHPQIRSVALPDLLEAVTAIPLDDRREKILVYEVKNDRVE